MSIGRTGSGTSASEEPSQAVALRRTSEELAAIDGRAAKEGKTCSEAIRQALMASNA
ncbi:hypothetical protein BJ994_000547 [Arthrobacter pigmenti]|uniref:CopG family transcriptional regulator n=1 Tax=Arthrobacter pigmenti TaxID=271432 RepID=A0A846RT46_9MICC|nr:ribbon-helix-helix protein, CopG family [Arthrobacter pigmenti]NJC21471.1 hypothetical protein [Arthrobacter pigmenti]